MSPQMCGDSLSLRNNERLEQPFIDILQDRRYWVIHLIALFSHTKGSPLWVIYQLID